MKPIYLDDDAHDARPTDEELAGEVDVWERIQAAVAATTDCLCNNAPSPCDECSRVFTQRNAFLRAELAPVQPAPPTLTLSRVQRALATLSGVTLAAPARTHHRRENH